MILFVYAIQELATGRMASKARIRS